MRWNGRRQGWFLKVECVYAQNYRRREGGIPILWMVYGFIADWEDADWQHDRLGPLRTQASIPGMLYLLVREGEYLQG